MARSGAKAHAFMAKLQRDEWMTYVVVPAAVSRAIGRGRAPVEARIGRGAPFRGTFMPAGGGRHRLLISRETREAAGVEAGERVRIVARVDDGKREVPIPPDLAEELRDAGVLAAWESMPPGKREHILKWIERAVHEATRTKRIAASVEAAQRVHEKRVDRERLVALKRTK